MRTVAEAIAGTAAPLAPGCNSRGLLLAELASHQCRFPLDGQGEAMRFCAVEVWVGDWKPGKSGGCYCQFHRVVTTRQPEAA